MPRRRALELDTLTDDEFRDRKDGEERDSVRDWMFNDESDLPTAPGPTTGQQFSSAVTKAATTAPGAGGAAAIRDIGIGIRETPNQVYGGVIDAVNEISMLPVDAFELATGKKVTEKRGVLPTSDPATSVTGSAVRTISQFLVPFGKINKSLKGFKTLSNPTARAAVAGMITDLIAFDPTEGRLSNLIQSVPALENPVTEFLASEAGDSAALGRFKGALEGLGLGTVADATGVAVKAYRARRALKRVARQKNKTMAEIAIGEFEDTGGRDLLAPVSDEDLGLGRKDGDLVGPVEPEAPVATLDDDARARLDARVADARRRTQELGVEPEEVAPDVDEPLEALLERRRGEFGTELEKFDRETERRSGQTLISRVRELGGVNPDRIRGGGFDFKGEIQERGLTGILRKTATRDLDEMADELIAAGDIPSGTSGNDLLEMLKDRKKSASGATRLGDRDALKQAQLEEQSAIEQAIEESTTQVPFDVPGDGAPRIKVNLARIDSPQDVKDAIQMMADLDADAINLARGGEKQSLVETAKLADELGMTVDDLVGRRRGPMSGPEAVAARKLLTSSGTQLVDLARKAGAERASQAEIFAFRKASSVHYAIQTEVFAARTETARALSSWRIAAGSDDERARMIQEFMQSTGGAEGSAKAARRLVQLAENGGSAAVNKAMRRSRSAKFFDAVYEVWVMGILSGPKTQARNILSNTLTALHAVPERRLASKLSGPDGIAPGEASALAFGMMKGVREGMAVAADVLRTGKVDSQFTKIDNFSKIGSFSSTAFGTDPSSQFGRGIDYVGEIIRAPGRGLLGADEFFKTVAYRGELNARAYRQGVSEGLEGDDLADRILGILDNPPEDMRLDSLDFARYQTFTGAIGEKGRKLRGIRDVTGGRYVMPFFNTPANILKYSFERTPLAPVMKQVRSDLRAGGARGASAQARIAMGSMIMLWAADMVAGGEMTGALSPNRTARDLERDQGKQPFGVKLGDRWFSLNGLEPAGFLIGTAAEVTEIIGLLDEEDQEMLAVAASAAFVQNLSSKSWNRGLFDFIDAVQNPRQEMGRFMKRQATSFVPFSSLLRTVGTAIDPEVRMTEGVHDPEAGFLADLVEQMKEKYGLSDGPPRRNLWGEPITYESGLGVPYDLLSPLYSSRDDPDAVDEAMIKNRVSIGMPTRSIDGVPLTAGEYSELILQAGRPAKEQLDRLIANPGFKNLPSGAGSIQAELMEDIIQAHRDVARATTVAGSPDLRDRILEFQTERIQTLVGR